MSAPSPSVAQPAPQLERMAKQFVLDIRRDLAADKLVWPSIPAVVQKIRQVMKDPDASVDDIAKAVSVDPALATRVVRFANSAIYGSVRSCRDLREAIVRLGSDALEHTVMLFVVGQVFSVGKRRLIQPYLVELWRHSTEVAAICDLLARDIDGLKPEVAALAGLIHDIGGLPVLVRAEKVPKLLSRRGITASLVRVLHTEVGAVMLDAWELPEELIYAVSTHEKVNTDADAPVNYADLVTLANVISHQGEKHPLGQMDIETLPAFTKIGLDTQTLAELIAEARQSQASLWG